MNASVGLGVMNFILIPRPPHVRAHMILSAQDDGNSVRFETL